jgi:hypothetical protein
MLTWGEPSLTICCNKLLQVYDTRCCRDCCNKLLQIYDARLLQQAVADL